MTQRLADIIRVRIISFLIYFSRVRNKISYCQVVHIQFTATRVVIIIIIYLPLYLQQFFLKEIQQVVTQGDLKKPPGL